MPRSSALRASPATTNMSVPSLKGNRVVVVMCLLAFLPSLAFACIHKYGNTCPRDLYRVIDARGSSGVWCCPTPFSATRSTRSATGWYVARLNTRATQSPLWPMRWPIRCQSSSQSRLLVVARCRRSVCFATTSTTTTIKRFLRARTRRRSPPAPTSDARRRNADAARHYGARPSAGRASRCASLRGSACGSALPLAPA